MSDYADWISDRDDQNQAGGGAAQPLSEGTQAAPTSGGGKAAAPADAQSTPSTTSSSTGSPSGFVPISSYYNANSDAAQRTAGTLSQPAQAAGQKAQDEQTGLQSDFNSGVTAGMGDLGGSVQGLGTTSTFSPSGAANGTTVASGQPGAITGTTRSTTSGATTSSGHKGAAGDDSWDWDTGDPPPRVAAPTPSAPTTVPSVSATPTQTVNPGQVSTADATKRGQESYTGPASVTDVNGYAQAASDANTAAQNIYALQSQGGRQALLQQQYAGSPYSQGQASFDSALTGAAANNYAALASQYGGINTNLSNLVGSTTTQADTARDAAAANAAQYAAEGHQGDADAAKYASDYKDWLNPAEQPDTGHGVKQGINDIMVQDASGQWSWQPAPEGYGDDPAYDVLSSITKGVLTAGAGLVNPFLGAAVSGALSGAG